MARTPVTFAESAVRDLEDILAWYEQELVCEVGRRLVAEIADRTEVLVDNPDMGRIVPEFGQKYLRELIHPPFRIVYKRERKMARVVRVWRSERLLKLVVESNELLCNYRTPSSVAQQIFATDV